VAKAEAQLAAVVVEAVIRGAIKQGVDGGDTALNGLADTTVASMGACTSAGSSACMIVTCWLALAAAASAPGAADEAALAAWTVAARAKAAAGNKAGSGREQCKPAVPSCGRFACLQNQPSPLQLGWPAGPPVVVSRRQARRAWS
jgi:hypothetical protein